MESEQTQIDPFDDSAEFQLNPQYRLQWEEAQQCHVLLYPEGLVRLSDTATAILQRCADPITATALVRQLCAAFAEAPAEVIEQDVREFVLDARQQGWLIDAG